MTSDAPYPPVEQPADGDRTGHVPQPPGSAPRYSASASVPVPPPTPQPGPAPYGNIPAQGQPTNFGQGYGQPGQASAPARAAASASVPVPPAGQGHGAPVTPSPGPTTYGSPPQGYPAQGGTYGQPGGSGQYGGYGSQSGGAGIGGSSQPGGPGGPTMGQGVYPPPGYGQAPESARPGPRDKMVPTGGWPYVEPPARPRRRRGLMITLIIIGALIVIGGAGGIGWWVMRPGSPYQVGVCVKQDRNSAAVVDCTSAGAFKITSIVDNEAKCPDPSKPLLVLSGGGKGREIACLGDPT